ncbi:MAG: nucleotide sugar dehydrogenase [Syntrophomonadaceae bacterium]
MFPSFNDFAGHKEAMAVVGMGYIGLPLAVLLGQKYRVLGFDINPVRVQELNRFYDRNGQIDCEVLSNSGIEFTSSPEKLAQTRFIIIAVPTPVDPYHVPDLKPLIAASRIVGSHMSVESIVVFESTVYPGATESVCVPVLEKESGFTCGAGFKVAYSPERVNPGDIEHTLTSTVKVVSAQDNSTLELLSQLYSSVIEAGVYPVSDIKTAEAAKVIENIQRDLNIALINELAMIFAMMKIDFREVLAAAQTKWNFSGYEPGLVGGHCIGVDPYYLTYKCEESGYHPQLILAGRRINNHMGKYIAEQLIKCLIAASIPVKGARVLILGITYKENIKDIRNTRIIEIYRELQEYQIQTFVYDPLALPEEVEQEYGLKLIEGIVDSAPYDAVVAAVKHQVFTPLKVEELRSLCASHPVLIDIKAMFDRNSAETSGFLYWSL